jgi:hypothetical protein
LAAPAGWPSVAASAGRADGFAAVPDLADAAEALAAFADAVAALAFADALAGCCGAAGLACAAEWACWFWLAARLAFCCWAGLAGLAAPAGAAGRIHAWRCSIWRVNACWNWLSGAGDAALAAGAPEFAPVPVVVVMSGVCRLAPYGDVLELTFIE